MPVMDGLEATRRIRQREQELGGATRTPIIAISASLEPKDRARGATAGMDDWYLNLPPPTTHSPLSLSLSSSRFRSLLTERFGAKAGEAVRPKGPDGHDPALGTTTGTHLKPCAGNVQQKNNKTDN
jgi:CheY-like chemotaxis protein